jgi:hypothetical protein
LAERDQQGQRPRYQLQQAAEDRAAQKPSTVNPFSNLPTIQNNNPFSKVEKSKRQNGNR